MSEFAPGPKQNTVFIVKNVSSSRRAIKIFRHKIDWNQQFDLLGIRGISEEDIRASLLKGELLHRLLNSTIEVIESDINLLQFNEEQRDFLLSKGITIGNGEIFTLNSQVANLQSHAQPPVANVAELLALSGEDLLDGTEVYVQTLKDWFVLDKSSAVTTESLNIENALDGGQWIRKLKPSQFWARQTNFYLDPINGDDENVGTEAVLALQTVAEFKRRILSRIHETNNSLYELTCHILNDVTEDISIECNWTTSLTASQLVTFDGYLGSIVAANGTVSARTVANPSTNQEFTITAPLTWSEHLGKIGLITSGPREGTRFSIIKDLGGNQVQISQPGNEFDFTSSTIEVGDTFQILELPQFGNTVTLSGPGGVILKFLNLGSDGGVDFNANNSYLVADACTCHDMYLDYGIYMDVLNSSILNSINVLNNSRLGLFNSSLIGNLSNDSSTTIFSNFSCVGEISGTSKGYFEVGAPIYGGWLACFDGATAVTLGSNSSLICGTGSRLWGKNFSSTCIVIKPGGSLYYRSGLVPNIAGSGAEIEVGGIGGPTAYSQLPGFNINNGSRAVLTS